RLPIPLSLKGWIYAVSNRRDDAVTVLNELKGLSKTTYVAPIHLATIYAGLGEVQAWRNAMLESYEDRSNGLVFLKLFPQFERLRSDPVFLELVQKIGLP